MSDAPTSDVPVRDVVPAHRFDEAGLHAYLRARLHEVGHRLEVRQFQGGASNPTFLLTTDGGHRFVLRKKPPGQLLSSAHQVDREYRVMKALEGLIPVPRMRVLCEDPDFRGGKHELKGTGRLESTSDLGCFNDKASSVRFEKTS